MRILRLLPLAATLLLLGVGGGFLVAQAQELQDDPEAPPPKVAWETPVITGTVTGTTTFTATATVSPTVRDPECVVRPKKYAGDGVGCTVITGTNRVTVTLTVTPTDDNPGASFNFQVFLRADDEERVLAPPLRVRLFTGQHSPEDEDNDTSGSSAGPPNVPPGKGKEHRDAGPPWGAGNNRPEISPPGPPTWAGDHGGSRGPSTDDHGDSGRRRGGR